MSKYQRKLRLSEAHQRMRTGSTLVHMHSKGGYQWSVVPGGVIDDYVAEEIKRHPAVVGQRDGLFPQHDQTWRMRSFVHA
jgi:hypothetical protein